jgi:hypothetical protein
MCRIQIRLTQHHQAADAAYLSALIRMKDTRGEEFERVWRLLEQRRTSLARARQALHEHEEEHQCGLQNSFVAVIDKAPVAMKLDRC